MPDRTRYGTKLPAEVVPIQIILQADTIKYSVITSTPPTGKYKITDLYYDPNAGKIIIMYDNTPTL